MKPLETLCHCLNGQMIKLAAAQECKKLKRYNAFEYQDVAP